MTDPHIRNFVTDAVEFDEQARRLEGRFVPYNEVARVVDPLPAGGFDVYQEGFRPGVFGRQLAAPEPGVLRRIGMVHAHDGGLGFLGPVTELREDDGGLLGVVSIVRSRAGDVRDLLDEGVDGLSIEFLERKDGTDTVDGVRWRTDAHLVRVALEAQGAYAGAKVLALRATPEGVIVDELDDPVDVAAAEAAAEAEAEATAERQRKLADIEQFLAAETTRQAELVVKYRTTA